MTKMWTPILFISVAMLASDCASLLQAAQHRSLGNPIDMPISLKPGQVTTPQFAVKNGPYDVIIRLKRKLPVAQIDCMLGIRFTEPDCQRSPLVVLRWTLWSRGKLVASGPPVDYRKGGGWSPGDVELFLGGFNGKKHTIYSLKIDVVGDAAALAVTDPHLVVQFSDYN